MSKIGVLVRSSGPASGGGGEGHGRRWRTAAQAGPALWAVVAAVVAAGTLLAVLWRFDALQKWLVPYVHLVDRIASLVATGFLVLPLLVWMTEGSGELAKSKAQRLWDVGILATCAWLLTSVAHLLAHYTETGEPASLNGFFAYLGDEWEAQLLALQATLLVATILAAVVSESRRDVARRSEPHVLVVGLTLAALASGALTPTVSQPGSTRFLLAVHVLAAVVWVSALAALALLALEMRQELTELRRVADNFSQLALVCAVTVLVSGGAMALAGLMGPWPSFLRGVGVLLVLKAFALCLLVVVGYVQRGNLKAMRSGGRCLGQVGAFLRWAVIELMLMAATLALSVGVTEMVEMTAR